MGCNLPRKVAESSPDSWIPNFHPLFPKKNFIFFTYYCAESFNWYSRERLFIWWKKFPYKFVYENFEKYRFRKNESSFFYHYLTGTKYEFWDFILLHHCPKHCWTPLSCHNLHIQSPNSCVISPSSNVDARAKSCRASSLKWSLEKFEMT